VAWQRRHRREQPTTAGAPERLADRDRQVCQVGRVDEQLDAVAESELGGTTGVIGVTVGADDPGELGGRAADRGDRSVDLSDGLRESGIDECQVVLGDEVRPDSGKRDLVNARRDLDRNWFRAAPGRARLG